MSSLVHIFHGRIVLHAHIFHGRFVCETHIFHGKNVMEGGKMAQKSPDRGGRGWGKGAGLYGLFRVGFGGGGLLLFFELGDALCEAYILLA